MYSPLNISKIIAGISFVLGTLLLVLFLFFKSKLIVGLGIYYVITALVINTLFFIGLLARFIVDSGNRLEILKSIGLILMNLPIAIGYLFIVTQTF